MAGTKSSIIEAIVRLADAYCVAAERSRASVSKAIFGRGGQINALADGRRDLNTSSAETALVWFSRHWPDGADWPADVPRPPHGELVEPIASQGDPLSPAAPPPCPAKAGEGEFPSRAKASEDNGTYPARMEGHGATGDASRPSRGGGSPAVIPEVAE